VGGLGDDRDGDVVRVRAGPGGVPGSRVQVVIRGGAVMNLRLVVWESNKSITISDALLALIAVTTVLAD
jgi:hypothetical protein